VCGVVYENLNDAVGDRDRAVVLGRLPKVTGGGREELETISALSKLLTRIADEIANQCRVTYARPAGLVPPEEIEVDVTRRRMTVRSTPVSTLVLRRVAMPEMKDSDLFRDLQNGDINAFNSKRNKGEIPDLKDANLRGIDFRGANLDGVSLKGAYLPYADLRGMDLRSCDMEGASIKEAHISGVFFQIMSPSKKS